MEKDTYYIKLHGKANIPIPLHIGHNFKVTSDCSITQEQKDDNEDGSYSITYKAIPITCEIGVDNGPTIKAKDPRRNSQKIRNRLFKLYSDSGVIEDFDRVYDAYTEEINSLAHALLEGALKRIRK